MRWGRSAKPATGTLPWHEHRRLMYAGIPVSVAFQPADDRLAAEVWADLEQIDEVFNDHRDDSEIGCINAGGIGTFALSEPLAMAFACAEDLQQLTAGAFSITTGPLRRLWRHAARTGQAPDPDTIAACRNTLEPDAWRRDGNAVSVFDPGVRFDFGGLIKGMAVDQVMKKLLDAGTTSALVQCGGETACRGLSRRGQPHVLGIPDPQQPDERLWCTLRDPGAGLSGSTSGNYRNPLAIAGTPCHHIFDPRSGLPVAARVLSVSVVFSRWGCNGLADGLATAGSVIDWREWLPMVTRQGGEALVLALEEGQLTPHATPGWRDLES